MSFALDGVRVLELARFQAGPRGGMRLSNLGAEVIEKVADPVAGEMCVPGVTVKLSRTPGRAGPVPTPAAIDALRRDRVIA